MSNQAARPGCQPTRGSIIAIVLALVWMFVIVPQIVNNRGTGDGEITPEVISSELRESADYLTKLEVPLSLAAEELTAEADRLLERPYLPSRKNLDERIAELTTALELFKQSSKQRRTFNVLAEKKIYLTRLKQEMAAGLAYDTAQKGGAAASTNAATDGGNVVPVIGTGADITPTGGAVTKVEPEAPEKDPVEIFVQTDTLVLTFNTRGAALTHSSLRKFHRDVEGTSPLPLTISVGGKRGGNGSLILRPVSGSSIMTKLEERVWELKSDTDELETTGTRTLIFTKRTGALEFTKTFVVHQGKQNIDLDISVTNIGATRINDIYLDIVGPNGLVHDELPVGQNMSSYVAGRVSYDEEVEPTQLALNKLGEMPFDERSISPRILSWAALKNRYFTAIMQIPSGSKGYESLFAEEVKLGLHLSQDPYYAVDAAAYAAVGVRLQEFSLLPKEVRTFKVSTILTNLDEQHLASLGENEGYSEMVDFGIVAWLSKLLLSLLKLLYVVTSFFGDTVGGYGLAIILLTLIVKGALHPLQRKSSVAMHKMQKLAPQMKAIQKKYERDKSMAARQKMQMEIADLYKRNDASPMGGCLPILIQLPMLLALFGMLRGAFELRHASFLWIDNLAAPDNLFTVGSFSVNLLPLIYVAVSLVQQNLQPAPSDEQQQSQRKMMKYMLIFFAFIFYSMPAALVLYFAFSGIVGAIEQWYIREYIINPMSAGSVVSVGDKTIVVEEPKQTSWEKADEKAKLKAEKRKNRKGGGQK